MATHHLTVHDCSEIGDYSRPLGEVRVSETTRARWVHSAVPAHNARIIRLPGAAAPSVSEDLCPIP